MTGIEPAGLLARLTAWIVDRVILGTLWILLACWGAALYVVIARWPGDVRNWVALAGLLLLLGLVLHAAYFVVFVGGCGQTPGKMLCGVLVVGRDGRAIGYGRALLRWFGYWAAALPLGLGFVSALFTAERRGLHDFVAGTRVVQAHARSEPAGVYAALG